MDKLSILLEKLIPGQLKEFHKDVINNMYDRHWCKEHELNYSEITYSQVAWTYYKELQKDIVLNSSH